MASTNKTSNYELPLFVATDKPGWLTDFNDAMQKIDDGIHAAYVTGNGAETAAENAQASATAAQTAAEKAETAAESATEQIGSVSTIANQALTTATEASTTAATANATATTANTNATAAQTTATSAQTTATAAAASAQQAQTLAQAASGSAQTAQTAATAAQSAQEIKSVEIPAYATNADGTGGTLYYNGFSFMVSGSVNPNSETTKFYLNAYQYIVPVMRVSGNPLNLATSTPATASSATSFGKIYAVPMEHFYTLTAGSTQTFQIAYLVYSSDGYTYVCVPSASTLPVARSFVPISSLLYANELN